MYKDITFLDDVTISDREKLAKFIADWNSNVDFITVKTSGSTGQPKNIKLNKKKIKVSVNATLQYFKIKPKSTFLLAMPMDYIAAKMMVLRAILGDCHIIVANPSSNPLLKFSDYKIDFSAFVPLQVQTMLNHDDSKLKYENIDQVIIGGAPISDQLEKQISDLKNKNYATFGMTETISHVAVRNISNREKYFTALPHVKFGVTDSNQLTISSDELLDEEILTNDIVELIDNQKFIWKGRADFVINSGGIKLHPEVIEAKIKHILPHLNYYLIGEKNEKLGTQLVLKIESNNEIDKQLLLKELKAVLTKYELPKKIIIIRKFNRTETGKLIRD